MFAGNAKPVLRLDALIVEKDPYVQLLTLAWLGRREPSPQGQPVP